jgi:microcystin degradation protein MlrC
MNHESNSLNPIITGEDDFVTFYGEDVLTKALQSGSSIAGICGRLRKAGAELIPTVSARAVPNGVVSAAYYAKIKAEFIRRTRRALEEGGIDGICFALHGSMKVESAEGRGNSFCAEGDLAAALREILPDLPFTCALDMHATVTRQMLDHIDGFTGYKTAPHVDCEETGEEAAEMLLRSLQRGKKLFTAYQRIPMLIAGEKSESEAEPMRSLIAQLKEEERKDEIEAASFLLGFPWADDENEAAGVLVTAFAENKAAAEESAARLSASFWEHRADFKFRSEYYDTETSVAKALEAVLVKGTGPDCNPDAGSDKGPVFISDSGDNPTAGAAGDSTDLLEALLRRIDEIDRLPTPLLYSGFYDAP